MKEKIENGIFYFIYENMKVVLYPKLDSKKFISLYGDIFRKSSIPAEKNILWFNSNKMIFGSKTVLVSVFFIDNMLNRLQIDLYENLLDKNKGEYWTEESQVRKLNDQNSFL